VRVGQNPAKFVADLPKPAKVTIAMITYIPFLGGYFAESLDVLKTSLQSLWTNTSQPFDLMIFDNASCPEVRSFLNDAQAAGRIQYLVLSAANFGKAAAWNFLFNAAPGEVLAYADADIYFEPGWLEALTAVLDAFPQAGMVTGIPMWSPDEFSTETIDWARRTPGVHLEHGKLLPWEDYWKHARSLGQTEAEARSNFANQEETVLQIGASRYYVGAGHFQFVARKAVLQEILPIEAERPMGQVRRLDAALNDRGYLRLSTSGWWVRHLGNSLEGADLPPEAAVPPLRPPRRPLQRLVQWIYHRAFEYLYKSKNEWRETNRV